MVAGGTHQVEHHVCNTVVNVEGDWTTLTKVEVNGATNLTLSINGHAEELANKNEGVVVVAVRLG